MRFLNDPDGYKLARILYAVSGASESWSGWSALVVRVQGEDGGERIKEGMDAARSVLESFLQHIDGHAYVDGSAGQICALCRQTPKNVLVEAGEHISSLLRGEKQAEIVCRIFSLEQESLDLVADAIRLHPGAKFLFEPVEAEKTRSQKPNLTVIEDMENGSPAEAGDVGAVRVLLVEDDPVTRWMVRNTLKSECRFAAAATASQACSLYGSYRPDVVFLDINLPDRNGHAVLDWIMRNDPGACVVMFSSNSDLENISSALDDGASGFVSKPFLKESLLRYVRDAQA